MSRGSHAFTLPQPVAMEHGTKNDPSKPKYHEPLIPARSCCARCLYNIPSGTLLSLLPGVVLLLVGSVSVVIGHVDENWTGDPEFIQAGFIMLGLGAVLTVGSTVYCTFSWCQNKPEKTQPKVKVSPHSHCADSHQVSLVAVHRLPQSPAHTGNGTVRSNPAIT